MSHKDVSDHNSNQVENKKRKLLSEYYEKVRKKANLEHKIDSPVHPKLFPVIGDEYYKPVETEKMFVGKIVSKKETSRLIKELSNIFPFEGSHLKRVRWTKEKDVFEILLRPLNANETVEDSNSFPLSFVLGDVCLNTTGLVDTAVLMDIPKNAALTYKQFQESSHFWPLQFRENKHIENVLKDQFFTDNEKTNIAIFMKMAISAANYGDEKVGCIVVDPATSHVIAISHDQRNHHPLQHAVMVAADLVAKSQGGGSWHIKSEHMYHQPFSQEETDEKINKLKEMYPERDAKKMGLPYLCTGYDLYVSREPCVMCAMGLVHSRIRRVFYATSTPWGALGSHWKLHLQPSLNHHYEVWKVSLEDENISEENGVKSNVQSSPHS